jgi:hypothetical protein
MRDSTSHSVFIVIGVHVLINTLDREYVRQAASIQSYCIYIKAAWENVVTIILFHYPD